MHVFSQFQFHLETYDYFSKAVWDIFSLDVFTYYDAWSQTFTASVGPLMLNRGTEAVYFVKRDVVNNLSNLSYLSILQCRQIDLPHQETTCLSSTISGQNQQESEEDTCTCV